MVTRHLLHGANSRMPLAFARALGLRAGTSETYTTRFGDLSACWPRHAASTGRLGSLRIPARELLAAEGDCLFVILAGKDELDFHLVEQQEGHLAEGLAQRAAPILAVAS